MRRHARITGATLLAIALAAVSRKNSRSPTALPSPSSHKQSIAPPVADIFVRSCRNRPRRRLIHVTPKPATPGLLSHRTRQDLHRHRARSARIGSSSRPPGGYDKKTQAADIRAVVTTLGFDRTFVVSHDIGIMVAYAYAALPRQSRTPRRHDAPLPASPPGTTSSKTTASGTSPSGHRRRASRPGPRAHLSRSHLERLSATPLSLTN